MNELDQLLLKAISEDNYTDARAALDNGANPNAVGPSGMSMLHAAACHANAAVSALLINYKADVGYTNQQGMAALHYALIRGKTDTVIQLLQNNADVNHPTKEGSSPLSIVVARNVLSVELESIRLLLRYKPDLSLLVPFAGKLMTVVDIAREEGLTAVTEIFDAHIQENPDSYIIKPQPAPAPPPPPVEDDVLVACEDLTKKIRQAAKNSRFKIVR